MQKVAISVLGAMAFLFLLLLNSHAQEQFDVTVLKVIDGDTVIIDERCSRFDNKTLMRVRIFGIDTPDGGGQPFDEIAFIPPPAEMPFSRVIRNQSGGVIRTLHTLMGNVGDQYTVSAALRTASANAILYIDDNEIGDGSAIFQSDTLLDDAQGSAKLTLVSDGWLIASRDITLKQANQTIMVRYTGGETFTSPMIVKNPKAEVIIGGNPVVLFNDLLPYARKTEIPDVTGFATKSELTTAANAARALPGRVLGFYTDLNSVNASVPASADNIGMFALTQEDAFDINGSGAKYLAGWYRSNGTSWRWHSLHAYGDAINRLWTSLDNPHLRAGALEARTPLWQKFTGTLPIVQGTTTMLTLPVTQKIVRFEGYVIQPSTLRRVNIAGVQSGEPVHGPCLWAEGNRLLWYWNAAPDLRWRGTYEIYLVSETA